MNNIHPSGRPYTKEEFLEQIKIDKEFNEKYGNRKIDQVENIINSLKTNPYSRYHVLNAWAPHDFKDMALPPCHLLYQFIVRPLTEKERSMHCTERLFGAAEGYKYLFDKYNIPKFYLDLNMYQRSCDTFLGVPFNIASMSLLLHIFAKTSNMIPGIATWIGGDTHLYMDHIPVVKEQLARKPLDLPELFITKELNNLEDILSLDVIDFEVKNYKSHPRLKGELFTGNKK